MESNLYVQKMDISPQNSSCILFKPAKTFRGHVHFVLASVVVAALLETRNICFMYDTRFKNKISDYGYFSAVGFGNVRRRNKG